MAQMGHHIGTIAGKPFTGKNQTMNVNKIHDTPSELEPSPLNQLSRPNTIITKSSKQKSKHSV